MLSIGSDGLTAAPGGKQGRHAKRGVLGVPGAAGLTAAPLSPVITALLGLSVNANLHSGAVSMYKLACGSIRRSTG
jgi:hypothetical protein